MRTKARLGRDHEKSWRQDGHDVTARISPCSWMYPGYGLQVEVSADGARASGASVFRNSKKRFEDCTVADFDALVAAPLEFRPCARCGDGLRLVGSRDTELCERCFLADLDAEYEREVAKANRRDALEARRMLARGFTHRTLFWIHPAAGGDDYQVDLFTRGEPTAADIAGVFRKHPSARRDDLRTERLKAGGR